MNEYVERTEVNTCMNDEYGRTNGRCMKGGMYNEEGGRAMPGNEIKIR